MRRPAMQRFTTILLATSLPLAAACSSTELSGEQKEQALEMHTSMALGYYSMGEVDRAEHQALKGLDLDPDDETLQLILAWTLQRRGSTADVLRAEQIFRRLQDTDDYRAVLGLGEALEQKGKAYDDAARGIRSGKQFTEAEDPLARATQLTESAEDCWDEAADLYHQTLDLHPEDRDALNGLQRVYALLGRYDESLEASDQLLRLTKSEMDFWVERLERAEITAGEEGRMRSLVKSAQDLWVATQLHVANVLRMAERLSEAEDHLTEVIELNPVRYDVYGRRAQVRIDLTRYVDALADIDEFLRLTPEDFEHPDTQLAYELRASCEAALSEEP